MSRTPVRLAPLLALLAAAALLVVAGTAATAAGTGAVRPPGAVQGSGGPVATGQFGVPDHDSYDRVSVTAEISNCGPHSPLFRFTLVSFRADRDVAYALDSQLRPYQPAGPTPVAATMIGRAVPG